MGEIILDEQHGLRRATMGFFRATAYAQGGYSVQQYVSGPGWVLFGPGDGIPMETEIALLKALGIEDQYIE